MGLLPTYATIASLSPVLLGCPASSGGSPLRALGAEAEGWNPVIATVAPDEEWRAVYDARYPLYRELHEATRHIGHALADSAS
ncbi:hypothetical protein [Streptomyces hygroscopicus]|uniref:hypothetical protein n=1 Tax=Streptomyces hygroscopicus TaxID=1912 RepID=UPI0004CBE6D9|nr:hypothetical protein [Streptomyces hygroscopicus]